MNSLYFGTLTGSNDAPNQDVEKVTRNTYPVSLDAPPAEMSHAPEFNEVQTDGNPEIGYATHLLASDWHQPEKYSPGIVATLAQGEHDDILNKVQASKGTAATREESGVYGHGTMAYAVGVEPIIRPGTEFGTDYFKAHDHDANETTNYDTGVRSTIVEGSTNANAMQDYRGMTRYASQATVSEDLYAAYLAGG